MGVLTDDMKRVVEEQQLGFVASVRPDGAPNLSDVNSFRASVTTDTLNSGDPTLPFFVDGFGGSLYTGAITAGGEQKTGFSASITVNPALLSNPSALVRYSITTSSSFASTCCAGPTRTCATLPAIGA